MYITGNREKYKNKNKKVYQRCKEYLSPSYTRNRFHNEPIHTTDISNLFMFLFTTLNPKPFSN